MDVKLGMAAGAGADASLTAETRIEIDTKFKHRYIVECFDRHGRLKWIEEIENIVVNVGLDDMLDKYYKGAAYTASHFVGLKGTGALAAGDTMASHVGWAEGTPYSNATRPAFTPGAVSAQSVDNSASKAVFNIDSVDTVAGSFLTTDNTKGGAVGTLVGGGDFATARTVDNGDTLNVTVTGTLATA